MAGNWTQHSFLDQDQAKNDYVTALTCIETPYNTLCFNDGYHTSHHLNPLRHWQDHPDNFLASLEKYRDEKVIIFRGVDYWQIWCLLMVKNYDAIADCFVDLTGKMTHEEKVQFLKARTKRLTSEQIEKQYPSKKQQ